MQTMSSSSSGLPKKTRDCLVADSLGKATRCICVGNEKKVTACYSECSLFRRFAIPKVRYSEGPLFQRFVIPKTRYSNKVRCSGGSLFRRLGIPEIRYSEGLLIRRPIIPKVRYFAGPFFPPKVRYSAGFLFRRPVIPKGRYPEGPFFWMFIIQKVR